MRDEIVGLIQECVRNKCVNPPGGELRSIKTVEKYLSSFGVETEVFESDSERGNLYAEIKGSGEGPSLMFGPSHVDVVPVGDPTKWEVPPFDGVVRDGFIWGRGTLDMLFIVACQCAVFAHLSNEGFKPKGDFKLLVVSDEEAGGEFGASWMIERHPDKVKVDYLITEAGGYQIASNRFAYNYGEKGATMLKMHFKGAEQHGSMPYGAKNAVVEMATAVQRLMSYQPPIETSFLQDFVGSLDVTGTQKWMMTKKRLVPMVIRMAAKRSLAQAKIIHSLSQMTISPNVCQGGTKINTVAGSAHLEVDIRTLPGQDHEYVMSYLARALGRLALLEKIEPTGSIQSVGNSSAVQSPLVDTMSVVLKEVMGNEANLVPMIMFGATDCRFFRKRWSTEAYGFSLFDDRLDAETIATLAHGDNERVSLGTLDLTSKIYLEIARKFLS
ncbi:MAG: M20/M25/M40 family metallo-hydrolase [Candidatus Thorarchaeota archaeon]|jgi:acetylornithine deacetylase/succinyl-diaminopimelate desuccinylase-like protein